jgi:multisubunit Na+/H+ antiporter MnhG subunit
MNMTDIIGTIGVGLILVAYFLHIFNLLSKSNKLFFLLNIAGAGLACYASWMIDYWPFIILEGTWFLVSLIGFIRLKNV